MVYYKLLTFVVTFLEEPGFRRMPIIRAREFLIQHLIAFFLIQHLIPHFF